MTKSIDFNAIIQRAVVAMIMKGGKKEDDEPVIFDLTGENDWAIQRKRRIRESSLGTASGIAADEEWDTGELVKRLEAMKPAGKERRSASVDLGGWRTNSY